MSRVETTTNPGSCCCGCTSECCGWWCCQLTGEIMYATSCLQLEDMACGAFCEEKGPFPNTMCVLLNNTNPGATGVGAQYIGAVFEPVTVVLGADYPPGFDPFPDIVGESTSSSFWGSPYPSASHSWVGTGLCSRDFGGTLYNSRFVVELFLDGGCLPYCTLTLIYDPNYGTGGPHIWGTHSCTFGWSIGPGPAPVFQTQTAYACSPVGGLLPFADMTVSEGDC